MKCFSIAILTLLAVTQSILFAQTDTTVKRVFKSGLNVTSSVDTTSGDGKKRTVDVSIGLSIPNPVAIVKQPSLSLFYGPTSSSMNGVGRSAFNSTSSVQLQISNYTFSQLDSASTADSPLMVSSTPIILEYTSPQLGFSSEIKNPVLTMTRIGMQFTSGYAYSNSQKQPTFSLLHNGGFSWQWLTIDSLLLASETERSTIAPFATGNRFGGNRGFTARWHIGGDVSIDAQFDRLLVYNGVPFFRFVGSYAVEGISQSLLDIFLIRPLVNKESASLPVVNVILKSALSFLISELRRSSQFFPLGGNDPIINDSFRIGMTIGL
jgi:hypothetical protein